uniref:Uncharacterized protein n=1 Tax=Amphora coffeiformis TaxID=265554 RepID=A0A7S3L194_9STRA|mmetsp:Transcript_15721/g.29742  ORF Transcript_15721/g.29742 Transcript_15721/m.29742 type:complete len:309 (+) Transcript_15721:90-1016(+)|eukprot:scaffold4232_cov215-Amphora_coffeaeformis.AAC.11
MKTLLAIGSAFTAGVLLTSFSHLSSTLTARINTTATVMRKVVTLPSQTEELNIHCSETITSASINDLHEAVETPHSFDNIVQVAYERATEPTISERPSFDIDWWERESNLTTTGGLRRKDRILLAEVYSKAESVFEYGLGESTYMADYLKVPRYAGTDSDPGWVDMARRRVSDHFRFYFSDIGATREWGYPINEKLAKSVFNYQLGPLIVESLPFDVYMVDGRYRLASVLASFLHASARGGDPAETTVLLHDCHPTNGQRKVYNKANHLLNLTDHSGTLLCVYQRFPNTTDEQLEELWYEHMNVLQRM